MEIGGVYKIENILTNQFYIGSSVNICKRLTAHLCLLRNNKHANIKMQRSFNKYGEDNFKMTTIENACPDILIQKEQQYVTDLQPLFNLRVVVDSSKGVKLSEETKKRMSEAKSGKPLSEAQKQSLRKIHENRIGKPVTGKVKDSLKLGSMSMIGKPKSEETKHKISLSKIGKRFNKEKRIFE